MTVYQWDGSIPEWALTGYRVRGATFPVPKGGNKEAWVLALLIERKSEYYFWCAHNDLFWCAHGRPALSF